MQRYIRFLLFSIAVMPLFNFSWAAERAENKKALSLEVNADCPDYRYHVGDTAVLRVEIMNSGKSTGGSVLRYRFSDDYVRTLEEGELKPGPGTIKFKNSLDRPGFLRLDLSLIAGKDTLKKAFNCLYDPEAIRPTNILPPDYQRFWGQSKAELMRIPVDPRLEETAQDEVPGAKRYKVSLSSIEGSRIYGWLTVPQGTGPFPAVVYLPGAPGGIREYSTYPWPEYTREGMIVLALNIHGIELGKSEEFYKELDARGMPGDFPFQGCDDPYRYFYRRVALGGMRALDYLAGRADVDTSRLAVAGASQGGGLSLIVAMLDRRIKALTVNVPAMCDYTGVLYGRPTGWPHLLDHGDRERVLRTAAYFDAALASGFIEVPALFALSLADITCPPSAVYAAYNSLKGPKQIDLHQGVNHQGSFEKDRDERLVKWLAQTLKGRLIPH